MFTPQRKGGWAGWSVSRKVGSGQENGSAQRTNPRSSVVLGRGKDAAGAEETQPPSRALFAENVPEMIGGSGGGVSEDWKRFRESGLLDEKGALRKEKEDLLERVSALEREHDECLYNMGLLLIEKKEWSSQIEELKQALIEAEEILKREQAAHVTGVSELDKREENLKKALGVEKQCVADLEKALREMRAELAETKFTSDKKLTDARVLETALEEKKMEIEAKLHAIDARLAQSNRKNSEMSRKFEDLEMREHKLQRDLSSLNTERKALENDVSKQREHLQNWEKELQEKQRRLLDEKRLLNDREERANGIDAILKKKEMEIGETKQKIDVTSSALKSQENDFKDRLRALTVKEKDAEIKTADLEKKEKALLEIEERLDAMEREGIQKRLDDHNAILDAKRQAFELEIVQKRKSFEEDVKHQMDTLEREKRQMRCREDQLKTKEEALEVENENLECKEKELDIKSKDSKKWEDSIKADEKRLQEEKKQLFKDSSELEASRAKLLNERAAVETEGKKIILERENLKITQKDKEQHAKLQEELKVEKEEYLRMMESVEKEKEALRKERETFEREWEVLDEKRVALDGEIKRLTADRENIQKWQHNEEERLKNDGLQVRANITRELEDLRLKKEAFEKMMEHERAESHSEVERERADMSRDFELAKHELEIKMQRKQDDLEKKFHEKEEEFARWREAERSRIKSSSESADLKLRRLETEQSELRIEQAEFSDKWRKLEVERQEIHKDIDALLRLSKNLKDQREEFAKEKDVFLSVAEQCKTCHNCGVSINKFDLFDLGPLRVTEDSEEILLPSMADGVLEEYIDDKGTVVVGSPNSGSNLSRWFRKCASLFKISPAKGGGVHPSEDQAGTSYGEQLNRIALEEVDYEHAPSANHSSEQQMAPFDSCEGVTGELDRIIQKAGDDEAEASFDGADSFIGVVEIKSDNSDKKALDDENKELEDSSLHSEPSKPVRRRQPTRKGKAKPIIIRRTYSVKAVIDDAKGILEESSELKSDEQQNGDTKDSRDVPDECKGGESSAQAERAVASSNRPKRQSSEVEAEGLSQAYSESVSLRGRRKRRRGSSQAPAAVGDKRYNLRRFTGANKPAASQAKVNKKEAEAEAEAANVDRVEAVSVEKTSHDPQPSDALESSVNLLQKCTTTVSSALEVQSEKKFQYEIHPDNAIHESTQSGEQVAEDGDEFDGEAPGDTSDDEDDEEERSEKLESSMGKKLWHFFTT